MTLPKYEDQYINVKGKNIHYWVEGEGPVLVLVHGLACSAEFWQYNVRPLSGANRVYALDLLGFGRSDKDIEKLSVGYAASFLANFMDALGIEKATLVGNSMGGVACARFAAQYPSRVDKLILVDSAGFGRELHPLLRSWSLPVAGGMIFSLYQRLFTLAIRRNARDSGSLDREWIAGAAANLRMPGVKENSLQIARLGVDIRGQREEILRDLRGQLPSITAPTLIIWGSHDLAVPTSHAYYAQELIPNSHVQILDRCGHIPQVERPAEFNQLVLDFLSQ